MASAPQAAVPVAEIKPFQCTESGCNKSFLRSEHLSRHRLNHRPSKVFSCSRCPKEFVRPDLYQRHVARHEKGMWYRNVGGIVSKASSSKVRQQRPSAEEESTRVSASEQSPEGLPINTPQSCSSAHPDSEDIVETQGLALAERSNQDISVGNNGLGLFYEPPVVDWTDNTLFSDGSGNNQDLPDNLEWFFEAPQSDLIVNVGLSGMTADSYLSGATSVFPPTYAQDQMLSTSTPYDSAWSLAVPLLRESLSSLPLKVLDSAFFYPNNLARCYELYFKNYHHHFPILHRPTISIPEAPPLLLTAIVVLGSTLAKDNHIYRTGQRIHDALRWIIFATGKFEPPAPLWCLQALLLVQAQGKMSSSTKQHEMAHIFHGSILTMMKRGRAYSTIQTTGNRDISSLESSWRQWAEDESTRRTAYFAFVMDAQHASVFGHSPVLSVSDMRLPLPYAESVWECTTAELWDKTILYTPKPPQFLPTLKALLGKTLVPSTCSDFSRFILLHGLYSLTNHLHARDTTTLGIEVGKVGSADGGMPIPNSVDWIEVISHAIETWSFSLLSLEASLCLEAARPLHRMAYIALYTNITDIHTLAKDPALLDNQLSRKEFSRAESRVRNWSRKDNAHKAINHALLLVKETLFTGHRYHARDDNIALRPWCLYHAALVLWAFGSMSDEQPQEALPVIGAEEYVARMLSALVRGENPIMCAHRTRGMMSALRDALAGCRWELLEEAYVTLDRLTAPAFVRT